jgi:transposase
MSERKPYIFRSITSSTRNEIAFSALGPLEVSSKRYEVETGQRRYDRLAANYLAFVQLASIRLWLRLNESAS